MKSKVIVFFLSLVWISAWSQNQRFMYEYRFALDPAKTDSLLAELMYLDVDKKGSKYYSREVFVYDSLISEEIQKQSRGENFNFNLSGIKSRGKVRYSVEKMYPDYNILYFTSLSSNEYKVSDDRPMDWKILPEKEKIKDWNVQKATLEMYGRKWTAWFSTDIPIQDGPYKFHGLPGLIVKIADDTNTHVMELTGVKNLGDKEWKSEVDKERYSQLISIDQKKYKKVYLDYRKDPMMGMRQQIAQGNFRIEMKDASGRTISNEEVIRKREDAVKKSLQKNSNILEIDLLQ